MKTSVLLANECGEPIHDFYLTFSAASGSSEAGEPDHIASVLIVEGVAEAPSIMSMHDFLQPVDRPFAVGVDDVVYLNADCHYGEDALAAIWREAARDDLDIHFVQVLPDQLDGLNLGLSGAQRRAFRLGRPIWRRGARSSSAGRGQKAHSPATLALRDAILAWTVIGEQIIRLSFERAHLDKLSCRNIVYDTKEAAAGIIEISLGNYPGGKGITVDSKNIGIKNIHLERYKYYTTHREGRRTQFARKTGKKDIRTGIGSPSQSPRYSIMPGLISKEIATNLVSLAAGDRNCRLDPLALAGWTAHVLLTLRVAHSASLAVDRKRSAASKKLQCAKNFNDLQSAAAAFRHDTSIGLSGFKFCSKTKKETKTTFGLHQLINWQDAALLSMLSDIDPRNVDPELFASQKSIADNLFGAARWLGKLYRERHGIMNIPQANQLIELDKIKISAADDIPMLQAAIATIFSFLEPEGHGHMQAGAKLVMHDGLARSVFITSPALKSAATKSKTRSAFRNLAALKQSTIISAQSIMPDPILIKGKYVLMYHNNRTLWQKRCRKLLSILNDGPERVLEWNS